MMYRLDMFVRDRPIVITGLTLTDVHFASRARLRVLGNLKIVTFNSISQQ